MNAASPHPETTRCLCLAARRASRVITREFDQALRAHGLRATQFTLLAALDLAGPLSISALADLLAADRTTITRNLDVVRKHGLVTVRTADGDARSRLATITPSGKSRLDDAMDTWRNVQHALSDTLGEAAADGLRRLAGGPCVMPLPPHAPT